MNISLRKLIRICMNTYSSMNILINMKENRTSTNMNIVISMLMNTLKFTTRLDRKRRTNLLSKERPRNE